MQLMNCKIKKYYKNRNKKKNNFLDNKNHKIQKKNLKFLMLKN